MDKAFIFEVGDKVMVDTYSPYFDDCIFTYRDKVLEVVEVKEGNRYILSNDFRYFKHGYDLIKVDNKS